MNIDLSKMKTFWWEDEDGNVIDWPEDICERPENGYFYRTCHPCQLTEQIDEFCYHPKNWFIKLLCRNRRFYKWFSKGKDKTFKPIITFHTSFSSEFGQKCIVAMVNSGDYTLEQAIWVYCNSCERCMNVLLNKYLNGADGYEEGSDEWKRAHTSCIFCEKPPVVDLTQEKLEAVEVDAK